MAISSETIGKWLAEGRNYGSIIVGFVGGIGLMSAAQQKGLTDALTEMANGVGMVVHGATSFWQILVVAFPIIGVVFAKWAKNSATVDNQAQAVKIAMADPNTPVSPVAKAAVLDAAVAIPEVVSSQNIKVTDPTLANLASSNNVVVAK